MRLLIQALDGRLSFRVAAHFHETKALAPAGLAVFNDLCALHSAILAEQLF